MTKSSKLSFDGNLVAFNNKYYLYEKNYFFDYKLKQITLLRLITFHVILLIFILIIKIALLCILKIKKKVKKKY